MASGKRSNNHYFQSIFLLLIGIIFVGGLLVFVHHLTTPIISNAAENRLSETLHELIAEAKSFEEVDEFSGEITLGSTKVSVAAVYKALDLDDSLVGHCVEVKPIGYGGEIDMLVAINKEGAVSNVEILSISETPGTGMKVRYNKEFRQSILGATEIIKAVNTAPTTKGEVQVISGATVSSKAYINGVNAALEVVQILEQEV